MSELEPQGEILIYAADDGSVKLDVKLENETLWMTQSDMAELFQTTVSNINKHIKNIYEEKELEGKSTIEDFSIVRLEGERHVERKISHYNLDMIISVGYRVKSVIATRFRMWATERLREYIIKGFTMDDERLKNPAVGNSKVPDYFDEMLERIRDIRASERRMYLQVKDIIALAVDYEPSFRETTLLFSSIQNKLHFAVTGMTAPELIIARADASKPNMNLTNWQKDKVRKSDVTVAKNYLKEEEITELNRIVTMCLDYAEDQARRRKQIFLQDWETKIDQFLEFNERNVLHGSGSKKRADANQHASREYDKFDETRREKHLLQSEKDYAKQLIERAKEHPGDFREGKKGE
ncbi:MAG: virulence RhuM family protein [Victivallales bacterium]|nr:virulence RhuM family protein [Victivallales bacterium]